MGMNKMVEAAVGLKDLRHKAQRNAILLVLAALTVRRKTTSTRRLSTSLPKN